MELLTADISQFLAKEKNLHHVRKSTKVYEKYTHNMEELIPIEINWTEF